MTLYTSWCGEYVWSAYGFANLFNILCTTVCRQCTIPSAMLSLQCLCVFISHEYSHQSRHNTDSVRTFRGLADDNFQNAAGREAHVLRPQSSERWCPARERRGDTYATATTMTTAFQFDIETATAGATKALEPSEKTLTFALCLRHMNQIRRAHHRHTIATAAVVRQLNSGYRLPRFCRLAAAYILVL